MPQGRCVCVCIFGGEWFTGKICPKTADNKAMG